MRRALTGGLSSLALVLAVPAVPAVGTPADTTYVVNSIGDQSDLVPGDDECDVDDSDAQVCTLRAAIEESNAGDGATIQVPPGLDPIVLGASLVVTQPVALEGNGIELDGSGLDAHGSILEVTAFPSTIDAVTLTGPGATAALGDGGTRGLHAYSVTEGRSAASSSAAPTPLASPDLVLTDLTASGGNTTGDGGGILLQDVAAQLDRVTATGNHADNGGGIAVHGGNLGTTDLVVDDNTAQHDGGGLLIQYVYPREEGQDAIQVGLRSASRNVAGSPPPGAVEPPPYEGDGGGIAQFGSRVIYSGSAESPAAIDGNEAIGSGDNGLGTGYGGGLYIGDEARAWLLDATVVGNDGHHGGGLYLRDRDELQVERTRVAENNATEGGGVYNRGGAITLLHTDVVDNTTDGGGDDDVDDLYPGNGGGIWTRGNGFTICCLSMSPPTGTTSPLDAVGPGGVLVLGGSISGNTAADNSDESAHGGGIWAFGDGGPINVVMRDTRITENVAQDDGGGIWSVVVDSDLNSPVDDPDDVRSFGFGIDAQRTDVSDNIAGRDGGGIWAADSATTLWRTSVTGNEAGEGGGIWTGTSPQYSPFTGTYLRDATVSGNTATVSGGGIWVSGQDNMLNIGRSTITANQAPPEKGPAMYAGISGAAVVTGSSIVADHAVPACDDGGGTGSFFSAVGPDDSANVFQDENGAAEGASSCNGGAWYDPADSYGPTRFVDDAGLDALTGDGTVRFHLLEPDSPAIDLAEPRDPEYYDGPSRAAEAPATACPPADDPPPQYAAGSDTRLVVRPIDGDGDGDARCDAGAVEFRGAVWVDATDDAGEPGNDGAVTIRRAGPVDADLVVPMAVAGTATPGSDYVALPTSATIPAGQQAVTVPVEVIDDTTDEPTETVQVTITTPEGLDDVGDPLSGTVNVTDDDVPAPPPGSEAVQLGGPTRLDTAVAVSNSQFAAGSGPIVLLATARTYADALSASSLAGAMDASLLLTEVDALPQVTADEIERLGSTRVLVLGGTEAVDTPVIDDLDDLGLTVERIGGEDRFTTATLIMDRLVEELTARRQMPTGGLPVLLTEGANPDPNRGWPDAMSASFVAAADTRPILLTRNDQLPEVTADRLRSDTASVLLVGGPNAIGTGVESAVEALVDDVDRVGGATRYDTGVQIVEQLGDQLGLDTDRVWLATGNEFVDGLVAGPAAARDGGVLLLIDGADPNGSPEVHALLDDLAPTRVVFVGGDEAISPAVQAAVIGHQP